MYVLPTRWQERCSRRFITRFCIILVYTALLFAGPILKELGSLFELKECKLDWNQLTGKKQVSFPSV